MASSSQSSTFGTDNLKSLSLFKFSYVTSPSMQGKLLWTHLPQRDNLFAVFDHVNSKDLSGLLVKRKFLKIIRGGDILVQVNLEDLVYQARLDEDKATSQPLADNSRLTILIVKKPLIALRYQLPDNQIQRMQMNFAPESGYEIALSCFSSLGLPIRDKNFQHEALQPVQVGNSNHSSHAARPSACIGSQSTESQGYDFVRYHDVQRDLQPRSFTREIRPNTTSTEASDRTVEGFAPFLPAKNCDSQLYLPSPSTSNIVNPFYNSLGTPHASQLAPRQPLSRLDTSDGRLESNPDSASGWRVPMRDVREDAQSQEVNGPTRRALFTREILEAQRPATVPRSTTLEAFSQILPPKRILPFPDPPTNPICRDPVSKPVRSSSDVPSRPEAKSVKKRKPAIKKPAARAKRSSAKAPDKGITASLNLPEPANSSTATSLKTPPDTNSKNTMPLIEGERTAKVPTPLTDSTPNKTNTQQNNPSTREPSDEPQSSNGVIDTEVSKEWSDRVDNFVQTYGDRLSPAAAQTTSPLSNLAEYAKLPEKERLAALDKLILEYVQDENFTVLCEDVEKSLRRKGLEI